MDFAKDYLSKYGWQEGKGIGKDANGIVKPIRANLKFDQAGLSFDKAKELTNPWWEKVFDDAAENLNVHDSTFTVNKSEEMNSANGISVQNFKSYEGYFQKENHKVEHDEDDNSINSFRPINDEDLLKACGGRTAHKGARHGLTLSGKLSRIVAQEKQLLNENVINTENAQNIFQTWIQVKKKKHKKKKSGSGGMDDAECTNLSSKTIDTTNVKDSNHLDGLISQGDYQMDGNSKKKKKKNRARDEDLAKSLSKLSTSDKGVVRSDSFGFYGLQSNSKVIKKKRCRTKSSIEHKYRKVENHDEKNLSKVKNTKRNDVLTTADGRFSTSDDSEKDIETDSMALQIREIMSRYPSKKFKVEAKELTRFQKKQLRKSGLRIEFKSQKRERKINKNQVEKIIKKMKHSMDFGNSGT